MATQGFENGKGGVISEQLAQYPKGLVHETETLYLMMSPSKMIECGSKGILTIGSLEEFIAKVEKEGRSVAIAAPNSINFRALLDITGKRRLWGESAEPANGIVYRMVTYHSEPPPFPTSLLKK